MQEIRVLEGLLAAIKARYEDLYRTDPKKASKLYSAYTAISDATALLSELKLNKPSQILLAQIADYIIVEIREGRYLAPVGVESPLIFVADVLLEPEALQLIKRLKYEVACSQTIPEYGGVITAVLLQLGELRGEIAKLRKEKPRKAKGKAKEEVPFEF